jgi:glycosyltransferase 2 family protein
MRKQFFIGFSISAVCLYFAFRGLSVREIIHAMQQADLRWVALAVIVNLCGYGVRTLRWTALMASVKPVPPGRLLRPLLIGFFGNNVLPFRMGELVRAHVAGRTIGISRTASLGTIVLERLFDSLSFLTIFLCVMFFFPFPDAIRHAATIMGIGCILLIAILAFGSRSQARIQNWTARLPLSPKWREKLQSVLANFSQGISGMTHGPSVLKTIPLSIGVWALEATMLYLITQAFNVPFTYPQAFFLLFFLGLSVALPQAPGYVGTMELFGTTALSLLGIPREQGLPIILTVHGTQFMIIMTLGVWALWKEGLLGDFWKGVPAAAAKKEA